ncbi:hypothetical protein CPB86DRAFT_276568 [Serendipita vermifera]|nr:hypothetical protein CPB86DRAFT_276568 [Serendipita vermifera]
MISADQQSKSLESHQNKDYNDIVKRLEGELATLLASKRSLEQEIESIIDIYPLNDTVLISTLPIELLSEVLDWVIKVEPSSITNLKLVCRAWYRAIIETPQLSTSIRVIVPAHLDGIAACAAFCQTAVRRSGQLPLDIMVNYSRLPDYEAKSGVEIEKEWVTPGAKYPLLAWKNRFLRMDGLDHPLPRHLLSLILKPLVALIGEKGAARSRWRAFDLVASKFWYVQGWGRGTLPRAIFMTELMGIPTPLLETLSIQYTGQRYGDGGSAWYFPAIWRNRLKTPFPDLSRVTKLSLLNLEMPISDIGIDFLRIEHLEVPCCNISSFRSALKCQNVTFLSIGLQNRVQYRQNDFNDITHIPFPRLRHLRMPHGLPNFLWQAIDAPRLEVLVFEDFSAVYNARHLGIFPHLSRVEFRWPYMYNLFSPPLKSLLVNFATNLPSLETLVCTRSSSKSVKRLLKEVKEMGHEFRSLKTMVEIYPNHDETSRELVDMVAWLA